MKNIAIFRIAFNPTPNPEFSNYLANGIIVPGRENLLIPNPFGVLSIIKTEKSVEELESEIAEKFPTMNVKIFEVTPQRESQPTSTAGEYANHSLDQILELITQVGGIENLPEGAAQRLNQLSGGQ